jgi:hypothetical protein
MPNTGGGAAAGTLSQSLPMIAGLGLLGGTVVTLLALRRRDV